MMDSFKLVSGKIVLASFFWGITCAFVAYVINSFAIATFSHGLQVHSKYIAPLLEELIKTGFVIYLVSVKRVGFTIDAAIYGFATGAGFSMVENIYYMYTLPDASFLVWIIRGFGTALMHGGCTAIFAVIFVGGKIKERGSLLSFLIALISVTLIHSAFNHFYINPVIQTLGIIILLPLFFIIVFRYNINQLGEWLEVEFSSEIEMLRMINRGELSSTKAGKYFLSIKEQFSKEVIVDMYCYLRIYMELSIKAKSNIMLKESGIEIVKDPEISDKLAEFKMLRKRIGKVGELVLSPLIRMNYRNLWKINQNFIL
jgi:hypothetical protein